MNREDEKNESGQIAGENSIDQQSQEAWKKYGDKAAEKGFTFKREGEGLPDEKQGDNGFVSAPTKNTSARTQDKQDEREGEGLPNEKQGDNGFVSAPTKNNSGKTQGKHEEHEKENNLHETVTLDTEPYNGPSKLAPQPDMDDAGQNQKNNSSNEDYLGGHASANRSSNAPRQNKNQADKNTVIKVDELSVEKPLNTENRTFTAEASHNLNANSTPEVSTLDAAERDRAIGKDLGPERNNY